MGGRSVLVRSAKYRVLLAALLLEPGRLVTVGELIEAVWEGALPRAPRRAVQLIVTRVRALLEREGVPAAIVTGADGYLLDVPPEAVDVRRFERLLREAEGAAGRSDLPGELAALEAALAQWRGEVLADVHSDRLHRRFGSGLEERRLRAVERRIEVVVRLGRHDAVLDELARLTAQHPLRETLWVQLMRVLRLCGRRAEALEAYHRGRRHLVEELGVEPGEELRRLHAAILYGTPEGAGTPDGAGALEDAGAPVAPVAVVPRQLPMEATRFAGRVGELERMHAALGPRDAPTAGVSGARDAPTAGARGLLLINGMAGVGKTSLALHWSRTVVEDFPDGQLWCDLRGYDRRGALAPRQALVAFLGALGVADADIPAGEESQAGMYRSLMDGRRILVVLDNAASAEQVRLLLPGGPGTLVVVTSRSELTGLVAAEGALVVRLSPFTRSEARSLLSARLGAERAGVEAEAADRIIDLCGGLPLALAIVAARAAARPHFPLTTLERQLDQAEHRLDNLATQDADTDVRAVFSWSYHALPPPAARLFRLLGLHPGPDISARAAAALAGLPLRRTRELLVRLTGAHLLTEHGCERYVQHDLLHAYAAELAVDQEPPQERHRALERVLSWYLHTADAAYPHLAPLRRRIPLDPPPAGCTPLAFDAYDQALAWCEAERRNLLAAVRQAAAAGLPGIAWRLAGALWGFLYLRSHLHDWLDIARTALHAARTANDRTGEAHSLGDVGCALTQVHRYAEAIDHFRQAIDHFRELGDVHGRCMAQANLAYAYRRSGRPRKSVEYLRRVLAVRRLLGDDAPREGNILANLGETYLQLGRLDDALDCLQQALTAARLEGDRWSEGCALYLLGSVHHRRRHHHEAIAHYRRALDTHADIGNRWGQAHTLGNLGDLHLAMDAPEAARTTWQRALAILDEIGHADARTMTDRLRSLDYLPPERQPDPVEGTSGPWGPARG